MIRIGVVGCGEAAQIIHLPTFRELRDDFRVTALCDVSRRVLDGVGEQWSIAARFTDHRDLVASKDVDAVLIANPHVFHAETAAAAMRAGKHVFIEKPMCVSLAEADGLLAVERETGVVAQVGYMRRYAPAFAEAVRLVRQMKDIRLARVHDVIGRNALVIGQVSNIFRGDDLPAAAAAQAQRRMAGAVEAALGRQPQKLQNAYALLLGLSSHDVSAMRELLGFPKSVLYASARGPEGRSISAAFDYGDFTASFTTAVDMIPRFDGHIEVFGAAETVRVEYDTPYIRNLPIRLTVTRASESGGPRTIVDSAWRDPFAIEWLAFRDNIRGRSKPKTSIADAREDLVLFRSMVEAMLRAETEGRSPA